MFAMGDLGFYKREGYDKWLGPGKVVCQDKIIFVRHGYYLVQVFSKQVDQSESVI